MPRLPAAAVEAVPEAVADRERVEADALVELDVEPTHDPFAQADVDGHDLLARQDGNPLEPVAPGSDVLLVHDEDRRELSRERLAEPVDDPALEEHPVRQQVREDEPDTAPRTFLARRPRALSRPLGRGHRLVQHRATVAEP